MKKYKRKFKISKNIIIGITGILFSIGFPFIVLPIFVPAQQLWTPKFAISAVALFLTFYSVESAILVAVMIYKMQKLDMEKEHEKRLRLAKSAMGTALESGIGWIICPQMNRYPGIAATTKEIFIEHMAELQEILDSDQYRFLL